ncbi:hypothetical protein GC089_01615 [Cellulomonas sp. JZ18]|nr:hypothetical protein GC089_01615 [Cellulomonas sp. JZ18]
MPEGHTVHRIARQLTLDLVGRPVAVSSPQGRFADGAARLDGRRMVAATAVGKQLFCPFDSGDVLRVHLGLYGAWDLYGQVSPLTDGDAPASLGAPRVRPATRLRVSEEESEHPAPTASRGPRRRSARCGCGSRPTRSSPTCADRPRARC